MPTTAFGFSVGDFVAGVKLVKDLIDSLDEAAGAGPLYRRLVIELRNLERALTEVKNLRVHTSQACQKIALEQAASQCQDCIETFLLKNTKFRTTLGAQPTGSKWRTSLHKVQWAICKQDAVEKFRAEIKGHVLTINTLLLTIQLASTKLQADTANAQHDAAKQHYQESTEARALGERNNELLNTQADLLLTISRTVATCATQQETLDLQSIMLKVLETNIKVYEIVLNMQKALQTQLPPQVDRQQPIYFEDAHGRIAPFHIEFINSFEAFQAVLEVRFRHVAGLKKIQRSEYSVQEPGGKRKLNLRAPWDSVFLPGRKVIMSMVFRTPQISRSSCPGCQTEDELSTKESQREIQCSNSNCTMWYERISEIEEIPLETPCAPSPRRRRRTHGDNISPRRKRARLSYENGISDESSDEDAIDQFRRVQIIQTQKMEATNPSSITSRSAHQDAVQAPSNAPSSHNETRGFRVSRSSRIKLSNIRIDPPEAYHYDGQPVVPAPSDLIKPAKWPLSTSASKTSFWTWPRTGEQGNVPSHPHFSASLNPTKAEVDPDLYEYSMEIGPESIKLDTTVIKKVEYYCPVKGCQRSPNPAGKRYGRSFGTREDKMREHLRVVHESSNKRQRV